MANFDIVLEAPVKGASPYVDIFTPTLAGTETFRVFAGKLDFVQNQHWELVRGVYHLQTSADVANRQQVIRFYNRVDNLYDVWIDAFLSAAAITASKEAGIAISPMSAVLNVNNYVSADYNQAVRIGGGKMLIKGTDHVNLYTGNGVAADLHYACLTFKYLNYELGIEAKV